MNRLAKTFIGLISAILLIAGICVFAACNNGKNEEVTYTVTYVSNGGSEIAPANVKKGEKLQKPQEPTRDGYVFVAWYEDSEFSAEYDFEKPVEKDFSLYANWKAEDKTLKTITYGGQTITLSEKALYVDAALNAEQLGDFAFNSLQDGIAKAKSGVKGDETKIYLAADVYWTDDYTDASVRDKDDLIGLKIPQSYICLIGITGNRDDVVIASDRGQNAGANGNYNTLGIANGFHAKDITFGNYCNVDLVYGKDTSKNHTKRQEAITQAQVITKVPEIQKMDEWFFENCSFVSRLNLFSRDERPDRALYDNCHFECTDDSIGTGYISIYKDCDFDFYSNTPCGGASFYMQAYLGCKFTTHFVGDNKTLTLCKNTKPFAFIDCEFGGNIEGMTWKQSAPAKDIRQIVYNNTKDGQPFVIDPDYPETSVTPTAETLKAFKVGDTYNVYNLLNNAADYPEWDPLNQKAAMSAYLAPWNIQFEYDGQEKDVIPELVGDNESAMTVIPVILGYKTGYALEWTVDSKDVILTENADNSVTVKAENSRFEDFTVCLTATINGLSKVLHINIISPTIEAPTVSSANIKGINSAMGTVTLEYALSGNPVNAEKNYDTSIVEWYRSVDKTFDAAEDIKVATTTFVKPDSEIYKEYELSLGDVGYYLIAVITPQYKYSEAGVSDFALTDRVIAIDDLTSEQKELYYTDFTNLAYTSAEYDWKFENAEDDKTKYCDWTNRYQSGVWYGGYFLPQEYMTTGIYSDKHFDFKDETPYTYAEGCGTATKGTYGMQTTTQGARLVYADDTERADMTLTVELSPEKTAAQGFGSAKQFLDIFFKYDVKTMTGYGLRISREAATDDTDYKDWLAKSCAFQLMEYKNGVATPLTEKVFATSFLPGCKVVLKMTDNVLSCSVTTETAQGAEYPAYMSHTVSLSHTFTEGVNKFGGFGFQHTGTAGAGKSGNRTTIHSVKAEY